MCCPIASFNADAGFTAGALSSTGVFGELNRRPITAEAEALRLLIGAGTNTPAQLLCSQRLFG